jgi:hypothetical protein
VDTFLYVFNMPIGEFIAKLTVGQVLMVIFGSWLGYYGGLSAITIIRELWITNRRE